MGEIIETRVRSNCIIFELDGINFTAEFISAADIPGLVKHENEWRLCQLTYHTHREGKKIKPGKQQRPRQRTLGYFASPDECKKHIQAHGEIFD